MPRYVYRKGMELNDMFSILTFYGGRALAFVMENDDTKREDMMIAATQLLDLHEEDYRRSYDIIDFMEERYRDIFSNVTVENYKRKYETLKYRPNGVFRYDDPTELRKRFNAGVYIASGYDPYSYSRAEVAHNLQKLSKSKRKYVMGKLSQLFNIVDILCSMITEYISRVVNNAAESGDSYFCNHQDTPRFRRATEPFDCEIRRAMLVEYPDSIVNCKQEYGSNLSRVLDDAMQDMYKRWTIDLVNDEWMKIIRHSRHQDIWMETERNMNLTHSQTAAEMYYAYDCVTPKFIDGREVEPNPEHERYIETVKKRHYAMRMIFEELGRDREETLFKTSTPVNVYHENL